MSYLGVPLKDIDGRILGHLAVIDRKPMPDDARIRALFQLLRSERQQSCGGSPRRQWSVSGRKS